MVNINEVIEALSGLKSLRFFPDDAVAIMTVARMVCKMATTEEQVAWLVDRMTSGIYSEWTGPQELRACFCSKFKPADGINAYSMVYPDGFPSEKQPQLQLTAPALPPGHIVSVDTRSDVAMRIALAAQGAKDAAIRGRPTPEEIAAAPEWLRRLEGYE
jgi:hypothetical protein